MQPEKNARTKRFDEQYTNIIFLILSVVQGLAFSDLAARTASIVPTVGSLDGVVRFLHVVLSFCILLRVFQTYVTAGLDYKPEFISFRDVVIILLAGLFETIIFQYLGNGTAVFKPVPFYWWTAGLSLLAMTVYYVNVFRIKLEERDNVRDYYLERGLQRANGTYMAAVCCLAVFAAATWPDAPSRYAKAIGLFTPLVCSALLIVSTANSLYKTFGVQFVFRSDERQSAAALADVAAEGRARAGEAEYVVRRADRDQSADIARLCGDAQGKALTTVFGLIRPEAVTLFRHLVQGRAGMFSYRSCLVATAGGVPVAAALVLKGSPSQFARAADASRVVVRLGPVLAARCRRRFRASQLSQLPLRARGWWLVPVIWSHGTDRAAVCGRVIAEVVEAARHDPAIELVKAWCRERDLPLKATLLAAGFVQEHRSTDALDEAVGLGAMLIYERAARPTAATSTGSDSPVAGDGGR